MTTKDNKDDTDWNIVDAGRSAYSEDLNPEDNPHPKGTTAYRDWARGWENAKADDPLASMFDTRFDSDDSDE